MLDSYSKTKKEIGDNLIKLQNITASERVKISLQTLRLKLEADVFSLIVVGQFKRGKTTFINALLGKDLLPTAIIPLTSIITILSYGNELKITSFFENGTKKEITLDDLPFYITEKHNPKNEKKIDRVEITYPSLYLKNGVQIIDTPGVASVHEYNTKTTYEYLPRADAAIFLLSVDPPLTQAELHFLRDLKNLIVKTFFIQNKIDTVSDADREESLAFDKKIIEKEAGFNNINIYPVSAKDAMTGKSENNQEKLEKSGLPLFEQALEQFLMHEKGKVLLKSAIKKSNNFINEEIFLAELEEKSLELPFNHLENKIATLKKFIQESAQEKIDSNRLLAEEVKILHDKTLTEDIERLKKEKTKWLIGQLENLAVEHKSDNNRQFAKVMNDFIDMQIRNIFDSWRIEEEKILRSRLEKILKRFADRINKVLEQITCFSAELFGITDRKFNAQEVLPPEIEFRFKTMDESDLYIIMLDLVKKALPKILAHKLIFNDMREKVVMMVDRHCSRAQYDFSERMEKLIKDYGKNVAENVDIVQRGVLTALETALMTKQKTSAEITAQKTRVSEKIKTIEAIKESLRKLAA